MEILSKTPSYYGKFRGQGMVTLSFDDGREDFYRVSYPIMKKYGLLGTFHIVTGWVDGRWAPDPTLPGWGSTIGGPMTLEQVIECHKYGIEMSAHGDKHVNEREDLAMCVKRLKEWGVTRNGIVDGFASPGSGLTMERLPEMREWFIENGLRHARSGGAPGMVDGLDVISNMDYPPPHPYRLTSIVVKNTTNMKDLIPIIYDAIENRRWCILMLHSVFHPDDPGYGKDNWWWDAWKFEELCKWLSAVPDSELLKVTMRDGFNYAMGDYKESVSIGRRGSYSGLNNQNDISNVIQSTKVIKSLV